MAGSAPRILDNPLSGAFLHVLPSLREPGFFPMAGASAIEQNTWKPRAVYPISRRNSREWEIGR